MIIVDIRHGLIAEDTDNERQTDGDLGGGHRDEH
jgi:hypothetical protein